MAKLNKGIVSPVIESKQGFVFHAGGQNFRMTGSHIEKFENVSEDFNALVKANEMFNITSEGISFYYDYNNKKTISKIEESALANFDKLVGLNEKIDFLNENIKSYKVAGKKLAVTEVENELKVLESLRSDVLTKSIVVKLSYNVSENKFYAGNVELAFSTSIALAESMLAAAYIRYEDKALINLFEFASKNYNHYNVLEFISESKDGDVRVLAMRTESNIFVYKINESTKIDKFSKLLADAAIDYVAESTGADITPMVEDILESYKERRAAKLQKTQLMYEMIAFLKDQKGRLSEANRMLPDIKAADQLLNAEIARISEELTDLQNEDLLTKDDGYVDAEITVEAEGLPLGSKVKVDALEFTGKGKSDILTVFVKDEPIRVEKNKLQISAEDSI
jgi:hypothetical protein